MNPKDILDAWNLLVRASREEKRRFATTTEINAFCVLNDAGMVYPYFTGQGK